MFALPTGGFSGSYEDYLDLIHDDDRARLDEAIRAALAGETAHYEVRHRITTTDGAERWLETNGRVERDTGGRPLRMMGTVRDITVETAGGR